MVIIKENFLSLSTIGRNIKSFVLNLLVKIVNSALVSVRNMKSMKKSMHNGGENNTSN